MDNNLNTTIYAIIKGEYDNFRIVSLRSSKADADALALKMSAGDPYDEVEYKVQAFPLDGFHEGSEELSKVQGFRAYYNFAMHGYVLDVNNVVFVKVLHTVEDSRHWTRNVFLRTSKEACVIATTQDECIQLLSEYLQEEEAQLQGKR